MRTLNVFLAILVSLVIAALVLEGGLRLIGQGPEKTLLQFDETLGWSKKPNYKHVSKGRDFRVELRTNEHGLHGDPMPDLAKSPDTFRVLALGDSFVQGFSVDRSNLFVDLLERWWRSEGRRVEVINAGTEGYDTAQSVAWLEAHGAAFEPDLVLLFPYENDLYWNSQPHYLGRRGERDKPRYLADGSREPRELRRPPGEGWLGRTALGGLLRRQAPGDRARHLFQPQGAQHRIHREFAPLLEDEPAFMEEVRAHTRGALLALRRAADSLGAAALVVPIPGQTLYDPEAHARMTERLGIPADAWSPNRPVDLVLGLAQEVGLATLDPRAFLTERRAAGDELYHRVDWHFGPEGNRAFATFLHGRLDQLGLFPPTHAALRPAPLPSAPPEPGGLPTWALIYLVLWLFLTALYLGTYRDEPFWRPPLTVAGLLALVFALVLGMDWLARSLPPQAAQVVLIGVLLAILGLVAYKLGRRLGTIAELLRCFVLRGHWYLMPLIVVLLTVGSLLVVAASTPWAAPFIYTLF